MRLRLAALLAMISLCALAQRGGGVPMGRTGGGRGWGGQRPIPPRFPGIGRNQWRAGQPGFGPYVSNWPLPMWFDTPLCASPLFPLAPNCSFGDPAGSAYYPPPPLNAAPPVNVIVTPAPQPLPLPAPVAIPTAPGPDDLSNSPQAGFNATSSTNPTGISQAGNVDGQARPLCNSAVPDKFPPLIVLKTGAYSINRYWIKNKTLYFETTSGDSLSAPLSLLERIIPAR